MARRWKSSSVRKTGAHGEVMVPRVGGVIAEASGGGVLGRAARQERAERGVPVDVVLLDIEA
eukprot:14120897-Heterocapsa_arctica.AAC.1